jgi:uncharacterized membrane protein YhaH (DUF805 family)
MDLLQLLFGFRGRINRAKYWLAVIVYIAVMIVAAAAAFTLGMVTLFFLVAVVIYIPMIISGIAVGIKRLHDRDKSAWWLLVFFVLPSVLSAAAAGLQGSTFAVILSIASFAISIWAVVELGFLRGTSGSNQYGPDPLAS